MRALMLALVLAVATAVPAFADDDGSGFRPPVVSIEIGGPEAPAR